MHMRFLTGSIEAMDSHEVPDVETARAAAFAKPDVWGFALSPDDRDENETFYYFGKVMASLDALRQNGAHRPERAAAEMAATQGVDHHVYTRAGTYGPLWRDGTTIVFDQADGRTVLWPPRAPQPQPKPGL